MDITERLEEIILNQLVDNKDFFNAFVNFIEPILFSEKIERVIFELIQNHAKKYNAQITPQVLLVELTNIKGLNQTEYDEAKEYIKVIITDTFSPPTNKWLFDEVDKWSSNQRVENAIMQSVMVFQGKDKTLTKEGIPDLIKSALSITRNEKFGHNFLEDKSERWKKLREEKRRIPFNLEMFDKITKGGLINGTLNCVMAGTGIGKTIWLCHCAANAIKQGYNVLYISAEMDEFQLGERIDANLLGITLEELEQVSEKEFLDLWDRNIEIKAHKNSSYGNLIIKQYPTGTVNSIKVLSLCDELDLRQSFKPDIIIVDYLNICCSSRLGTGANVGLYGYIKAIAEEFRGVGVELDVPILSVTQVNRGGIDSSDPGMGDTAESMGLVHTLDLFLAMAEISGEENMVLFKQLKNRYADKNKFKRFKVGLDKSMMTFFDIDDPHVEIEGGRGKKKIIKSKSKVKKMPLFDKSTNNRFSLPLDFNSDEDDDPNTFHGIEV